MPITHRIVAATTDLSTQAGLVNFLTAKGFTRLPRSSAGRVSYCKRKGAEKALAELRKTWKVIKVDGSTGYETLECNGVKIYLSLVGAGVDKYSYVSWQAADFKTVDKTDVYNVTKYHPAWMWVQDAVDQAQAKTPAARKTVTKNVVDEYMREHGLSEEELRAEIVKRTRDKTVHRLYDTD